MLRRFVLAAIAVGLLIPTFAVAQGDAGRTRDTGPLTCDAAQITKDSYRLTTEAQALNVTKPRYRWWDGFNIGKHAADLGDLNAAAVAIAERAREIDDRNLLAHAQLARQYVVTGVDARYAHEEWQRTLDAGGAIVWTATLNDVDDRSYFVVAFDRQAIRIYRFGQLAGALRTHFGVPEFPGPDREELWRALGGCLPESVTPVATVPWTDVTDLQSGNYVLWFQLDRRVSIESDRRKRRELDRIMVNLHGATGDIDLRWGYDPRGRVVNLRGVGLGPAAYQERVRGTLVKFFDPEGRIKLPKQRRGAGW